MADARVLKILLGDVPVGHLTGFPDGKSLFAFDDRYIDRGPGRPTLSEIDLQNRAFLRYNGPSGDPHVRFTATPSRKIVLLLSALAVLAGLLSRTP